MDISTINELIDDLENAETSLSNVRNLSALYNVKTHLLGTEKFDKTTKELNDILPSYINYIETKRRYQLKEINETNVLIQLQRVCKEIKEFIQTLYSGTDMSKEREILQQMIKEMQ